MLSQILCLSSLSLYIGMFVLLTMFAVNHIHTLHKSILLDASTAMYTNIVQRKMRTCTLVQ